MVNEQPPHWLIKEFPELEIHDVIGADPEHNILNAEATLSGIKPKSDTILGIILNQEIKIIRLDEGGFPDHLERGQVPDQHLPGNNEERRLLNCLAANIEPGLDIELTVYHYDQLEALLNNYRHLNLRLTGFKLGYVIEDEATVINRIGHSFSDDSPARKMTEKVATLDQLLTQPHGEKLLEDYLQASGRLQFLIALDYFVTT